MFGVMSVVAAMLLAGATDPVADANREDLKCLTAMAARLSAAQTDGERVQMVSGISYFLGRIDARSPEFDYAGQIRALVRAEASAVFVATELARCKAIISSRASVMAQVSNALRESAD
jgi:hypothetical protein